MDSIIIFCAQYLIFALLLAAAVYWITLAKDQKIKVLIFGVITAVVDLVLAKTGSSLFYDTRPFVADNITPLISHGNDNGFPSDHTLLSSVVAVTIYSVSKRWGIALGVLALFVGGARVLAHVHRPIDIIGSIVFALVGGVVAYYLTPKIMRRMLKPKREPLELQ